MLYPITAFIEIGINFCELTTCGCVLCVFIATCYMFIAFAADIKQEINDLNEIRRTEGVSTQLRNRISEIIRFHSIVKQLSLSSIWNHFTFLLPQFSQ